jgi:hypothetical protein
MVAAALAAALAKAASSVARRRMAAESAMKWRRNIGNVSMAKNNGYSARLNVIS